MHGINNCSRKEYWALKVKGPLKLGTHIQSTMVHIGVGEMRVARSLYEIFCRSSSIFFLNGLAWLV